MSSYYYERLRQHYDRMSYYHKITDNTNKKVTFSPNISRMITISTSHIMPDTLQLLDKIVHYNPDCNCNRYIEEYFTIPVYEKGLFGYYLYLTETDLSDTTHLPNDLLTCIKYAKSKECDILCFDSDGDVIARLPTYSHDENNIIKCITIFSPDSEEYKRLKTAATYISTFSGIPCVVSGCLFDIGQLTLWTTILVNDNKAPTFSYRQFLTPAQQHTICYADHPEFIKCCDEIIAGLKSPK